MFALGRLGVSYALSSMVAIGMTYFEDFTRLYAKHDAASTMN
jgi:hypothetical protein